jgi:thiamine pyrophosphate-dependent acetolactate synthase large subunit-like protein
MSSASWGSDAVARVLTDGGIGLVTHMPGSTVQGLLETLSLPEPRSYRVVQCLHESSAVAVAHGFTKTSGRPAAVLLHSSVGLLNAAMAIYNAALDFAPLVLLVGTAPRRPERRRPWIDRIHAGEELAELTRHLVKSAAVPSTLQETLQALAAALREAPAGPAGPVAVFVDRDVLEQPLDPGPRTENVDPPVRAALAPTRHEAAEITQELVDASRPVLLAGRLGLDRWAERIELAEALGAAVLTDLRLPGAFPTGHPAYAGGLDLQGRLFGDARSVLGSADVVLALEWADPRGISEEAGWRARPPRLLFDVRSDDLIAAPLAARAETFPCDHRRVRAAAQETIASLLEHAEPRPSRGRSSVPGSAPPQAARTDAGLSLEHVASALREAVDGDSTTLVKVPVEWQGDWWPITDAHSYLGYDGGGGLGSGPGLLVGAALGLEPPRLALAVLGDGDLLMGAQALWTARAASLPVLVVVVDNAGYANEARHFAKIATARGRGAEWEAQAFPFRAHPADVGAIARGLGLAVFGPSASVASARACVAAGVDAAHVGASALVHLKLESP